MDKSSQFPGALLFMGNSADKRVFNFEETDQIESLNQHIVRARQRIENLEKQFIDKIDEQKLKAFEEGHQCGLQQATEQMLEVIKRCQSAENLMAELSMEAIKKVLNDLPENIVLPSLVSCAIRKIIDSYSYITVSVHPQLAESVKSHINEALKELPMLKLIEVREDVRLSRNDCQIETNLGTVNANLTAQLDAIEKVICGDQC